MSKQHDLLYGLNTETPKIMWIDLNSAFATAEQQAHHSLRGKPMGVTNRLSKNCCVIAASYEAKALGIKVGCRRTEALAICPEFILLETDPPKYHTVYKKLFKIMCDYTPNAKMKSIDEGVLDFHNTEAVRKGRSLEDIGHEIKQRVKDEIGDYTKINVGIAPNRFLAKTAAGLHKPDGLDVIDHNNLVETYQSLKLEDLTGIAEGYSSRLRSYGISTPMEFLEANQNLLTKQVFKSINGRHWYNRLRGYEVDDYKTNLGMVGRQWVVKKPTNDETYLRSCLHFLSETVGMKLRFREVEARGVCVWLVFQNGEFFRDKQMYTTTAYSNRDIWLRVSKLFNNRPKHLVVQMMGLYLYKLSPSTRHQQSLFLEDQASNLITKAVDDINDYYGTFTVYSAETLEGTKNVKQKIPFGGTEYFNLLLKRG